jgi:ATP synthase protein I
MVYSRTVRDVDTRSMKNRENKGPDLNDWTALALIGQVGLIIVVSILLGIGAGLFVDHLLHSTPIATLIGLLLGLAAGVYGVYRLVSSTS